jgi:hypothetical protein
MFFGIAVWVMYWYHPLIDFSGVPANTTDRVTPIAAQTVPTVINGIITSASVVIGFSGSVIGILFRDFFKEDRKARTFFILVIFLFAFAFLYPWGAYIWLTTGFFEFALKWAILEFLISLYLFIMIMVFSLGKLNLEEKEKSEKTESDKPRPETRAKKNEDMTTTNAEDWSERVENLIAEYNILNKAIWTRDQVGLVVNSIMISATLGIVTFAIQYRDTLGKNIIFNSPNAMFVPLVSAVLIAVSYLQWWTSTKLNSFCFDRIHEIENTLRIKGHHWVLEQAESRAWYVFRKYMWHFVFLVFIGAYLFTSFWLLRNSPTT